jgi:multidrug efflux pump subunit AcrA (membrane-fusion protein)
MILLLAALLLSGCRSEKNPRSPNRPGQTQSGFAGGTSGTLAGRRASAAGHGAAPEAGPAPVTVTAAEVTEVTPQIDSFGTLTFTGKTDVAPPIEGRVDEIFVREGDRVKKEDILARIENLQLQIRHRQARSETEQAFAAVRLAEARLDEGYRAVDVRLISLEKLDTTLEQRKRELDFMKEELQKQEELFSLDAVPREHLEKQRLELRAAETEYENLLRERDIMQIGYRPEDIQSKNYAPPSNARERRHLLRMINNLTLLAEIEAARAGYASALSELESAGMLLEELNIRAPADSVVGAVYLEAGERLSPGTVLFSLFQDREMYCVFPVQESEATRLAPGQEAVVEVHALGNKEIPGLIEHVAPTIDPDSGNRTVKALLPNAGGLLKPGMFARVIVTVGAPTKAVSLPESCLLTTEGGKGSVLTVANSRVFHKEVLIGPTEDGRLTVTEGIEAGELVVDSPSPLLQEGEVVEIRQ